MKIKILNEKYRITSTELFGILSRTIRTTNNFVDLFLEKIKGNISKEV